MKIIPAILPLRYYDIPNAIEKIYNSVDTVQIDFVDGHFAPNRTWWFNRKNEDKLESLLSQEEGLPMWESLNYEFDLMLSNPLEHIDTFVALGPSKIIFHLESLDQEKMLKYFEAMPSIVSDVMSFGIAIGTNTNPSLLRPYSQYITTIQCMGISQVGFQGQPFDKSAIEQIKKVKELFPDKIISVDGAVSTENASELVKAGATELVVGSAIFQNSDPEGTIRELKKICHLATGA